jgi:hypothetical protein
MLKRVLFLSVPFILGCCISRHSACKPKWRAETGVNAKFDPYCQDRPIKGIEVGAKLSKEW